MSSESAKTLLTKRASSKTQHFERRTLLEQDIYIHIFTVSAGLLGVCLTVIGIIHVVISTTKADTVANALLSADAILFLISCLLSYWSLRTRNVIQMHRLEKITDRVFFLSLLFMAIICLFITYEVALIPSIHRQIQ